jgi:hypothetical protein
MAQGRPDLSHAEAGPVVFEPAPLPGAPGSTAGAIDIRDALSTPGGAFAASLVLPGAGQAALGLKRWIAYGLLEAGLWGIHLEARADVRSLRRSYRDLAWETARAAMPEPRRDGDWEYYETMSEYLASGSYDSEPGTEGLQPEPDDGTYNGSVWALARALYLPSGMGGPGSSEYDLALDYYREHAAGPAFLWSWIGKDDALERFRALIRESDDEARTESLALGLVLANHLVSAVDAFLVARLRTDGVRLDSRLSPVGPTLRWSVGLVIPIS